MRDTRTASDATAQNGLGWTFVVLGLVQVGIGVASLSEGLNSALFSGLGFVLIGGMNVVPTDRAAVRLALGAAGLAAVGAGLVVAFL